MRSQCRLFALALGLISAVFGNPRPNSDSGSRGHRTRLAAGEYYTCAILDDGSVDCWGSNNFGQLGDGTKTSRVSPVPVKNLGTAVSIAAGSFHTCALLSNGTVRCWGLNDVGQLGNNSTTSSSVPVTVTGLTNVVALAAGFVNTCAVRVDGSVWCWGAAPANQSSVTSLVPLQMSIPAAAVSVAVGANHACALLVIGQLRCWGQNTYGQLGDFDNITTTSPHKVFYENNDTDPSILTEAGFGLDVSSGSNFTCSRWSSFMVCWGDNSFDQFGIPSDLPPVEAKNFAFPAYSRQRVTAFATGAAHTCVIVAGGTILCSGRNDASQLGKPSPVKMPVMVPNVANAVEITAGLKHTCAAIVDGTIRCWGDNSFGQHGNGSSGPAGVDSVSGLTGTFLGRNVTVGSLFSCGRRGVGPLACWGMGEQGQLGNSSGLSVLNPVAVTGISNAVTITTGSAHACLLDPSGVAKCWGDNSRGQLGNGTTTSSNQPVPVAGGLTFSAITAGNPPTCASGTDDWIYCWGSGEETGVHDSPIPVRVIGVTLSTESPLAAIAAGGKFNCLLYSDGTLTCWGSSPVATPGPIAIAANIVGISAGVNHVCALRSDGFLFCWGDNSRGQIGNNTTVVANFPATPVPGISNAVSVSAGAFFSCAVHVDGTASCWGANDSGELSSGDNLDHLTPTPVGNFRLCGFCTGGRVFALLQNVAGMATGGNASQPAHEHACALLATGVVDCWGDNSQGEIGDGTTISRSIPTPVNSFLANVDPAATLRNGHVAEVTALINCDPGGEARITLLLEQGAISSTGHAEAHCEERLVAVPVTIETQGHNVFQAGLATAQVEAIVSSEGHIVDDTHWTRQVSLAAKTGNGTANEQ
jgi:alpha-tubulin suppressor-like RCC1 family protein